MQTIKNKIFTLLTLLFTLLMLTFGAGKAMAQTYNGGVWYSAKPGNFSINTIGNNEFEVYPPSSGSITFTYQYKKADLTGWFPNFDVKIYCYVGKYGSAINACSGSSFQTYSPKTVSGLDSEATKVKFDRAAGNTHNMIFSDIKLPMAKHIRLKSTTNANGVTDQTLTAFSNTTWGTTNASTKTVQFRSFLTNGNITITCDKPEIFRLGSDDNTSGLSYAVGANAFAYESGSGACSTGHAGATSKYNFKVYFCPAEAKDYSATITITDGKSTATVHVSGKGIKRNQTINDFTAVKTKTTDTFDFDAYTTDNTSGAANGLTVTYSSNNTSVATINATTGKVTVVKDGNVTFTASQAGNASYNSTSKTVTWTISKVTPTVTWPEIESGLKYNESCAIGDNVSDHWEIASPYAHDDKGSNVEGSFECDDLLLPAKNSTGYTVTFNPTNTNWYNDTTATIKQDVAKADQTIAWDLPDGEGVEYTTGQEMGATSTSGIDITYTSSNPSVATIVDGKLNVIVPNAEVKITATCVDPAGNWNEAPEVSKTFKTCGTKPDSWEVMATPLVYGQSLAVSTLSGKVYAGAVEVLGKLSWKTDSATIPNAGTQNYTALFTPNDDAYGSITFDVSVTTERANPVLTWNIGTNLRADSKYSNFVVSTNKENSLTITTSSNLSYVGNVLTTGSVAKNTTQSGWIKVSQAATTNYYALLDTTVNVTILPRVDVCLPIESGDMDAGKMAEMRTTYATNVTWCPGEGDHEKETKYAPLNIWGWEPIKIGVKYTEYEGIQLGGWDEGFNSLGDDFWKDFISNLKSLGEQLGDLQLEGTDKDIELAFTGVPDSLSFDITLQTVSFDIFGWTTAQQKNPKWTVYQRSIDGTEHEIGTYDASYETQQISVPLDSTTRSVRIKLHSAFAGFVQNLKITQRKYIRAYTNGLTFGTNEKPLQKPQKLNVYYSSVGSCEYSTDTILVTTEGDAAFYVDRDTITTNVGIDQWGKDSIYVRCNDVNKSGRVIFRSIHSNAELVVPVGSAKPEISSSTTVFQTGTEHTPEAEKPYRTLRTHDFSACFNAGTPRFDSLYIYGVSASASTSRQWAYDDAKRYNVPVVTASNVHTPCFVYVKDNNKYVYKRTFDAATKTLNISANKKLAFMGYKPVKNGSAAPAIQLNGSADVYFNDAEINANGVALKVNNATTTVYSRGDNKLIANSGAAVQLTGDANLTIEDSWNGGESRLALNPSFGNPSIDLSSNSNVTIQGSQLQLHNALMYIFGQSVNMAIANMSGEKTTGSVAIKDGTITGAATLGMPRNTIIDGGTFNDGTVKVYDAMGREFPPMNTDGDLLARLSMAYDELPATGYGKNHLVVDAGKVHPMLEDPNICKFTGQQNNLSDNNSNWVNSWNNNDVIVKHDMDVVSDITAKSLTINPNVTVTVKKGATLSVNSYSLKETVGNLRVENGGKVILNGELKVKDLTLEASLGNTIDNVTTPASSGEVNAAEILDVNGDVYFKLALDPSGRNTYGWYDFVVPFEVDVIGGISIAEAPEERMVFNGNYAIMAFDERRRAETGKGWSKFTGTMVPGQVYTITLDETQPWNTVVFKKKDGVSLAGDRSITSSYTDVGDEKDRGWNGYGNATLHHTKLIPPSGVSLIQVYDHTNKCYQAREAAAYKIAVGMSFFMQVADKTVVALEEVQSGPKGGGYLAPARESREVETFRLSLTKDGQNYASDLLWVSASEEATGEYVIGHDLAKMGDLTSSKVARMWAKNNNIDLCDIEMPLVYGEANCDLNVFAPADGTYLLEIENGPADAELYLTFNGKVIWDLTSSPASLVLKQGLKEGFGLRMKYNDAPGMAEGVDDINDDTQSMRKVLIDNKIYIITPEGAMYDVNGKLIR